MRKQTTLSSDKMASSPSVVKLFSKLYRIVHCLFECIVVKTTTEMTSSTLIQCASYKNGSCAA